MSTVKVAPLSVRRLEGILSTLKTIVNDLTGIAIADMDVDANFLEAGIDSLTLIQASQAMQEEFGVKLSVVQLLEEHSTIAAVAGYLDQALPPEFVAAEQVSADQRSEPEPQISENPSAVEVSLDPPPPLKPIEVNPMVETNGPSNGNRQPSVGASSLERIMSNSFN